MPQFKTLQFPNTAEGQAAKVRALENETADGWRVVSETIVAGKFKTEKACCLFLIFAPCAFLAGHEPDMITITLERPDVAPARVGNDAKSSQSPTYDHLKWNALVQYDAEIGAAASELRQLGSTWEGELAAAYLAIADKAYLAPIVAKLKEWASKEAEEKAAREAEERRAADEKKRAELAATTIQRAPLEGRPFYDQNDKERNNAKWWIIAIVLFFLCLILASVFSGGHENNPAPQVTVTPSAPVATVSPSFDCSKVEAETLKLICTNPELAQQDLVLADAYAKAMEHTLTKTALRREERAWIKSRNNGLADLDRLRQMYKSRIIELQNYP